jgi:hypothetical protein
MKRYVFRLGLVLAALFVSVADSRAEAVPVSGEIGGGELVDPGELSISAGGILIIRDQVTDEFLTGDLAGTIHVTSTFMVNINTGEGILFGTIEWRDPNSDGGFVGPFHGQVTGAFGPGLGGFDGQWRLRGFGTHQGETALIDNFGLFSENQVYEGVIRVPGQP